MNPFKIIDGIYSNEKLRMYSGVGDRASVPPHIFATADAAFSAMVQNPPGVKANQVHDEDDSGGGGGDDDDDEVVVMLVIMLSGVMMMMITIMMVFAAMMMVMR